MKGYNERISEQAYIRHIKIEKLTPHTTELYRSTTREAPPPQGPRTGDKSMRCMSTHVELAAQRTFGRRYLREVGPISGGGRP